jgi:hypothetical protein
MIQSVLQQSMASDERPAREIFTISALSFYEIDTYL